MIYNDDEPPRQTEGLDGNLETRIIHKQEAPMEESQFKVLLELKGVGSKHGRLGVDLVTVLDISGSMRGSKLAKMKLAMQFLVKKLSPSDRLSVVTFNRKADRLCPLCQINDESRTDIIQKVNEIVSRSSTNTESGLKLALKILGDRVHTERRRVAIMLISDGMEDAESKAVCVSVRDVPVYTFACGSDCDPEVLSRISKNSNGGMFAAVPDFDDLNVAFSTALAGLLHVAIEDLTLTIKPLNSSQLDEVNAGSYPQTKYDTVLKEPVIITFRTLYDRETRRVLLLLTLPKVVEDESAIKILDIVYKYRVGGKDTLESGTKSIHVTRNDLSTEAENEEVLAEERRISVVSNIKEARILADRKNLEEARINLVVAKKLLSEVDAILTAQLDQLFLLMVSPKTYDEQGFVFALALEASHEAQRATTVPGADHFQAGMFNTPHMDLFIEQARSFDMDPVYKIPTEDEDMKIVALVH
ncbi:E3 ubiquitin-protein ligase WAVH1-like [Papaver somniferum]|uniref:E3 ubiquitin-protein ligase WAVH1-like n=1 Tax=Papaver somniferum TaxID=3469 RepID=UPI000E6FDCD5|nr:E3 ubiquitin-protein ligase WAVH1-like [Papaver somniferum]